MGLIEEVRELASLIKKAGDADLYRRIVELQGEIVNLSADKLKLEQKVAVLEQKLELKQAMKLKYPYYYQDGDANPFCRHCWEADGTAVHLDHPKGYPGHRDIITRHCHRCKTTYDDRP